MRAFLVLMAAYSFQTSGGCSSGLTIQNAQNLWAEVLKTSRELNEELDKVTDKATAEAGSAKIEKLGDHLEAIYDRLDEIELSVDERVKALDKKVSDEIDKENQRFYQNTERIRLNPETSFIVKHLATSETE